MHSAPCPSLYQINTRVWLTELSHALGRPATLDDIPNEELDRLATMGFDWVWFLSVWQTGPAGQRVSRTNPEWRREFQETLPDLREEDIPGSGFAITGYTVHAQLGGDAALARLRRSVHHAYMRAFLRERVSDFPCAISTAVVDDHQVVLVNRRHVDRVVRVEDAFDESLDRADVDLGL